VKLYSRLYNFDLIKVFAALAKMSICDRVITATCKFNERRRNAMLNYITYIQDTDLPFHLNDKNITVYNVIRRTTNKQNLTLQLKLCCLSLHLNSDNTQLLEMQKSNAKSSICHSTVSSSIHKIETTIAIHQFRDYTVWYISELVKERL